MNPAQRLLGGCFEAVRAAAVQLRLPYQANRLCWMFAKSTRVPVESRTPPMGRWTSWRILAIGQQEFGGTGAARLKAFQSLAGKTEGLDLSEQLKHLSLGEQIQAHHLYFGDRLRRINRLVLERAAAFRPDLVWVEKGLHLWPETLLRLRAGGCGWIIHFSPDNQQTFSNQSRHYLRGLPLYDAHVTTKRSDWDWLRRMGARRVEGMGKGFDPELHRPSELSLEEQRRFGCQIGFVGHWEPWREQLLADLEQKGYGVKVWGGGWGKARRRRSPLFSGARQLVGEEYAKAIVGAKISLCLLSRWFGDQTTARSVEIPACGGFLLAERNPEHLELFREGEEAEFYATEQEMLEKIGRYLRDEAARRSIAQAGRARCLRGYSNEQRLTELMNRLVS